MTKSEKRYLRKRRQISKIIMSVKVVYENWREDVYTEDYPSEPDAIVAAEKILSKMGLNKPSTLN